MSQLVEVSTRSRRWWPSLVISLLVAAVAAWYLLTPSPAGGDPIAGITDVEVLDNDFSPPVIEIPEGTSVTWTFSGDAVHNLVGDGWGQETPIATGTFTYTFEEPGTYWYECTLHRNMDGRVDVIPASEEGTP